MAYAGGSLSNAKTGEGLRLYLEAKRLLLKHGADTLLTIPAPSITEVTYGEEVHHRIGTGAALAVVSLGVGVIVAFSKSKKHYIGISWDGDTSGGIALQADKNEYRGLLAALEGVTGRTAVDADSPKAVPRQSAVAPVSVQSAGEPSSVNPAAEPAKVRDTSVSQVSRSQVEPIKGIVVRFTSTPMNAELEIDGKYWGSTPTAAVTRLPEGDHTIVVKKPGYQRWERTITLAPGDERSINAELEVKPVDLTKPRIVGLD
ncbi:MAG TPA: PEGA domain-containing protein [Bryobacteraceae bacterium]|nr:PEGA domain-containing protein [Bryobacteraceae bacterium]